MPYFQTKQKIIFVNFGEFHANMKYVTIKNAIVFVGQTVREKDC